MSESINADENHENDSSEDSLRPGADRLLSLIDRVRETPYSEEIVFESASTATATTQRTIELDSLPQQIGRFEIRRLLGEGGYGIVLLAYDPRLKREVAIKIPRAETLLTSELRTRFLHEAEAAAALGHPNIVPVFEAGSAGPIHYIASKYCPGQSLSQWLRTCDEPIKPRDAASAIRILAEAIQHAHDRGVLHRDLKPGNILIESNEENPPLESASLRITDFGLARVEGVDNSVTRTGSILGTPSYMSPEQADGRHADVGAGSDVYSLGAMLFEMLSGKPPFHGRNLLDTLKAVRDEDAHFRKRGVPADLAAICLKCLSKSISDRYETAFALQEDLTRFLTGQPVHARPASRFERLVRWSRRNPRIAFLSATSLTLLICLATGSAVAAITLAKSNRESLDHLEAAIVARNDATQKETLALKAVFESRIAQAKAARTSGVMGRRTDSLQAIEKAVGQIDRLGYGESERLTLRNKAIASLALSDLQDDLQWPPIPFVGTPKCIDPTMTYYAVRAEKGTISIRQTKDGLQVARLLDARPDLRTSFSADGNYIVGRYVIHRKTVLRVWDFLRKEERLKREMRSTGKHTFHFSEDARKLAIVRADRKIEILVLPQFKTIQLVAATAEMRSIRFDPTATRLAIVSDQKIDILQIDTGQIIQTIECEERFEKLDYGAVDWSPDGRLIAAACSDRVVRVWDVTDSQLMAELKGHGSEPTHIDFHPGGTYLATGSYDETTRICRVDSGQQILLAPGRCAGFSRDGNYLAKLDAARWRFISADPVIRRSRDDRVSMHPSGNLIVTSRAGEHREFRLFDVRRNRYLDMPWIQGQARFSKDGRHLIVVQSKPGEKDSSVVLLPVSVTSVGNSESKPATLRIGPPEKLADLSGNNFHLSLMRNKLVVASRYSGQISVIDIQSGQQTEMADRHPRVVSVDVTTDERLLATATWNGRDIRVWNLETGQQTAVIPSGNATVAFRPFEPTLLTSDTSGFAFRSTTSPNTAEVLRPNEKRAIPGKICYSADGNLLAITTDQRTVQFLNANTRMELATFNFDTDIEIDSMDLSDDASKLMIRARRCSYVCDLAAIRNQLDRLNLNWTDVASAKSIVEEWPNAACDFEVDLGELQVGQPDLSPPQQSSETPRKAKVDLLGAIVNVLDDVANSIGFTSASTVDVTDRNIVPPARVLPNRVQSLFDLTQAIVSAKTNTQQAEAFTARARAVASSRDQPQDVAAAVYDLREAMRLVPDDEAVPQLLDEVQAGHKIPTPEDFAPIIPQYSASSQYSDQWKVEDAFDGKTSTRWHSAAGETKGAWIAIAWNKPQTINSLEVQEMHGRITGFRIQQRSHQEWVDIFIGEGPAAPTPDPKDAANRGKVSVHSIRLPKPVTTSAIRFLVTDTVKSGPKSNVSIREFTWE